MQLLRVSCTNRCQPLIGISPDSDRNGAGIVTGLPVESTEAKTVGKQFCRSVPEGCPPRKRSLGYISFFLFNSASYWVLRSPTHWRMIAASSDTRSYC